MDERHMRRECPRNRHPPIYLMLYLNPNIKGTQANVKIRLKW